ncbi:hypothetical protein H0H93_000004 [Arthromyces matolae]|nr:hypothetical protein H0H93_000004 [Arthromyces matolae]
MSTRPSPGPSLRLKQQHPPPVGIIAGAEDAKYQTKYRELKRKVKDIETDNDKLHFKVLQAKRSIQRMKLERAILYERLAGLSSPNEHQGRNGPPASMQGPPAGPVPPPFSRSHSGSHHYQDSNNNDNPHDSPVHEYGTSHERSRIGPGYDMPPAGRMHSPPRRGSIGDSRHMQQFQAPPLPGNHGNSRPHVSPTLHHGRTRSHSSSRSRQQQQQPYLHGGHPHQYLEGQPTSVQQQQQQVMHSSPIQEKERPSRRGYDNHNHESPHGDSHQQHPRLSSFMPRLSPPPDTRRVHPHHQHISPGPPSAREREDYDRREREFERRDRDHELERNHPPRDLGRNRDPTNSILSPPIAHRSSNNRQQHLQSFDRGGGGPSEPLGSSHEPAYYDGPRYPPPHSRSGSPLSASGSGIGQGGVAGIDVTNRQESRHHYYEQNERSDNIRGGGLGFKLRPVNPPNEEMDFVHEDGRSRDRGSNTFDLPLRKRTRNEMDVDDDASEYPTGRASEDRGKRYHREHRRSIDNQSDGRMGPP